MSLVAVLAAALLAWAAPAEAKTCSQHLYGETCESEREHAEFESFAFCPFEASPELICSWALSSYKEQWPSAKVKEEWEASNERTAPGLVSEIVAGKVTIPLKQSITLQGGFGVEEEADTWFGAEGAPTIQPVQQLSQPLTKDVDTSLLSASELNRYNYYVKVAHETKVYATVELAGPASAIKVSAGNLLNQTGTAFAFPVKLKLSNPFAGNSCYVGSETNPVVVELTTGTSGSLRGKNGSKITQDRSGAILTLHTDTLVNNTFASPGVEGCGVSGGADAAINAAIGLPSPEGDNETILNGTLRLATGENAKAGVEGKI